MNRRKLLKAAISTSLVGVSVPVIAQAGKPNELGQYDNGWMETAQQYAKDVEYWKRRALNATERLSAEQDPQQSAYWNKTVGTFGWAYEHMLLGRIARRDGWMSMNDPITIYKGVNETDNIMVNANSGHPIGFIDTTDLMANDWQILPRNFDLSNWKNGGKGIGIGD